MKPLCMMLDSPNAVNIFKRLGVDWKPGQDLLEGVEEFVCALYGEKTTNVNEV